MPQLTVVRLGTFSGTALSLIRAFEGLGIVVHDVDIISMARRPELLPARMHAHFEARVAGPDVSWARTGAWSSAVQRHLLRSRALRPETAVLEVQTSPALILDARFRYAVYTDRVALQGAAEHPDFASRYARLWFEREKETLKRAQRVFIMGPSTKPVLENAYGIPPERIEIVGGAPNAPVTTPSRVGPCRQLLFVGTEWQRKGGPELIEAFAMARERFPDLKLTIVGCVPSQPVLAGVRVLGRRPANELAPIYADADAFVLPTRAEAFGIVFVEALQAGLPVIGTTVGNQPWIIGSAGILANPGDAGSLAQAICHLIEHYDHYATRAAARGRQLREDFSWPRIARQIASGLMAEEFEGNDGEIWRSATA